MHSGRDGVLAHTRIASGVYGQSPAGPLPSLGAFGDPVIEDLPDLPPLDESAIEAPAGTVARQASISAGRHFVLTREIPGYGGSAITCCASSIT